MTQIYTFVFSIALAFLPNLSAFANNVNFTAKVIFGDVTVDGKALSQGEVIGSGSLIESKDPGAFVQIQNEAFKFAAKGAFEFQVPESQKKSEWVSRLLNGSIRVYKSKGGERLRLTTPAAVAGVRGTEFFISYGTLLGETEIICFESEIEFSSLDGKTSERVKAGQWGGHGGRFGNKITPMKLSPSVLQHFDRNLTFQ